jgi:hypothetical protein
MALQLFHQNMMKFGGETTAWNTRMKKAFGNVNIGHPGARVLAAGFTEICNYRSAHESLKTMVRKLDPGLTTLMTVAVGRTGRMVGDSSGPPSKRQRTYFQEYLTVATQRRVAANGTTVLHEFEVMHAGKAIFLDSPDLGPSPAGCFPVGGSVAAEELPYNAKVDSRGIAYVVGRVNSVGDPLHGRLLVVAFMHNMYGVGDGSSGITGVPRLVNAIYQEHQADITAATAPCIVGGDFNVEPRELGLRGAAPFRPQAEEDSDHNPYLTTGSHVYDWWSCRVKSLVGAEPVIWMQTLKKNKPKNLSDHAGISLGLDANMW